MPAQFIRLHAEFGEPFHSLGAPVLKMLVVAAGLDEELHLHLLELARAEEKILRVDFVAEGFADLSNAKRQLLP